MGVRKTGTKKSGNKYRVVRAGENLPKSTWLGPGILDHKNNKWSQVADRDEAEQEAIKVQIRVANWQQKQKETTRRSNPSLMLIDAGEGAPEAEVRLQREDLIK